MENAQRRFNKHIYGPQRRKSEQKYYLIISIKYKCIFEDETPNTFQEK